MMAVPQTFQLPHELGICMNHKHKKQFKGVVGRGRLELLRLALSSHASLQHSDALSLHISDSINRPIRSIHSRHNVFICRSFLIPGGANEIPILKTAATALTRSYNALHRSSLVLQLVPALGIIVFAVWVLGPLMRHSRNFILHRSDSSWKKSSTYYVMTYYIRPLLLWTGATLVCRALDPVVLPSEASQAVKRRLLIFVRSLSTVLAFAYSLSSLIQQAQKFVTEMNDSNDTRNMGFQFAGKAVYTAVWVAAVSLFMELLGFSTQKWVTAGGLGTVLLTLAGREILTNFLSSVMIHATQPFVVNEWIQTNIEGYEVSGTVEHVGWWSPTIIRGDDREAVHIPNHKFTVNVVRNLTQKTHWRIKTHLAISHLDVNKINIIVADMRKVLAKNPQVEQQRLHRRVFLENINPENQALLILVSCFVKTSRVEEYQSVKEAILLDLLRVISHHRARLATPIRTVQKIYSDPDLDNIPYSDTIFTRTRPATHRPFLLIEPPYKVNGQARSVRANEAQDTKVTTMAMSDSKIDGIIVETPSDSEEDYKVASASISESKAEAMEDPKIVSDNADNNQLKTVMRSGETRQNSKVDSVTVAATTTTTTTSNPLPKSALEDNIVLGVALEGSKRTLPIEEEEMDSSQIPTATKELAACLNGNGKDKKDGQIPTTPSGDQRDQER